MGFSPSWSKQEISTARQIIGEHTDLASAIAAVEDRLGRSIHPSTLRRAFAKHGHNGPASYLKRPSLQVVGSRDPGSAAHKADREKTIIVCPDTHVPYHDPVAWAVFLDAARKLRPDVLVMIGDFADCYSISSHTKSPTRRHRFVEELDVVNEKLDELCALRIPRIIWTEGNHEDRLSRLIAEKVPELDGMVRTLQEYLKTAERGIEWVPYREGINIGKMFFTHDVGRCGVNAARQSLLDVGGNVCFGHSHRGAVAYQGTTKGKNHVALNVGWLGDYNEIGYQHKIRALRDWQHAFGVVDLDENGCAWAQIVPVVHGAAMVRGQRVAA